ncbi:hypothetical protein ACFW9D_05550 [Streptomyces sp. NPDC059524]|uniref:hypothetical protein n=1 Tax=Streptomyces sp. NPDC059524 TaxID=3346856 RepID=UPI0036A317D4
MARLVTDTFVKDPQTRLMVHLRAGEEPAPELAALVKNPDVWEDGKAPAAASSEESDKPAAKRAAKKPATGRAAADEGTSGT